MLTSEDIRGKFLDYFRSRGHAIVPSAPIVVKNDPTLMFTNAGMNQFKDLFLGNSEPGDRRVADTQKCLRVSGKHNDLEEVGVDTYHHTMFEMLGNWSFGDYFKKEAIEFAWELLTDIYKIDKSRIYVTVFAGDDADGLPADEESVSLWKTYVEQDRILYFDRKDNFWEMGDTGPCGPCSEIHVDLRAEAERARTDGASLVNQDHPEVIEIWNLVFIQFNRLSTGELKNLPDRHVDTGMGFERLCMVLQDKRSSYDTDVFTPLINKLSEITGKQYGKDRDTDIALRVVADHIRAIVFTMADGQLPSNTGAGYVIRRILRRAVRYYYNFLGRQEPVMNSLVEVLAHQFRNVFPEVRQQQAFICKVIEEEEKAFLRTLASGLSRLDTLMEQNKQKILPGQEVFELYDTYGFPADLTRLIAAERGVAIDEEGFEAALEDQRNRSRNAAATASGDWTVLHDTRETAFVGYDHLEYDTRVVKYRRVKEKNRSFTQVVLKETPFYGESGGQQGDRGIITAGNVALKVFDTKKENDLVVHYVQDSPEIPDGTVTASVNEQNRNLTCKNHSATHLLHAALRTVLGEHVQQKGSALNAEHLRFDFSHFSKMTDEELGRVEAIVNEKILEAIPLEERRNVPREEALRQGAMALFGEKYGDQVRMIIFDPAYSVELCGGTHVRHTAEIGLFKIVSETAIAAGVRRIEALTGPAAMAYLQQKESELTALRELLNHPQDAEAALRNLLEENARLRKQVESFEQLQWNQLKKELLAGAAREQDIRMVFDRVSGVSAEGLKKIAFDLRQECDKAVVFLASDYQGKPLLALMVSDDLVKDRDWNAGTLIREFAKPIQGGGGGQPFFATAGGKNSAGIPDAVKTAREYFEKSLHG